MNCPVCKDSIPSADRIESNLVALKCPRCEGHWISSYQYWRWRDSMREPLPELPPAEPAPTEADTQHALLCPECGRILRKYAVGRGVSFRIDQCGHCRGLWLDAGEWEALRAAGLHTDVHKIFTEVWQRAIRQGESREHLDAVYRARFGDDAYAELQRFRAWLDEQGTREAMLTFLADPDPWSVS